MKDKESAKALETAREKVRKNANPQEAYPKAPESAVLSDEALEGKVGTGESQILANGFKKLDLELDLFDNERNYDRVKPSSSDDGPKKKMLDQNSEE